jgi:hypothetical protein
MKFVFLGLWFQILSLFSSFLYFMHNNDFNAGFYNSLSFYHAYKLQN